MLRIGAVGFLNTLPLIEGLDATEDVEVIRDVPSRLVHRLEAGEVDVALCSSIDFQHASSPLAILPVGRLGSEGETLTVRLYSRRPTHELTRIHCDTDSHTSIVLLQIILASTAADANITLVPYDARRQMTGGEPVEWPEAILLIGDKVVTDAPPAAAYPCVLDLGAAWQELTGLPFTFALWLTRPDLEPEKVERATMILDRERRRNASRLDAIASSCAAGAGWPVELAREYLTERLRYDFTPEAAVGLELFFARAAEAGVVEKLRPLQFAGRLSSNDTVSSRDAATAGMVALKQRLGSSTGC